MIMAALASINIPIIKKSRFSNSKITALIGMLTDYGILEIAKTGTIAIERGRSTIYDDNKLKEEYDYGKHVL